MRISRLAVALYLAVRKIDHALAQRLHGRHIVADEQHGPPVSGDILHLRQAPLLETRVADCQDLVY